MTKEEKKAKKKKSCGNRSLMLAFGITNLGTRVVTAASLVAISLSFCSITKESMVFNDCVEEVRSYGNNVSNAVRFCNGGS